MHQLYHYPLITQTVAIGAASASTTNAVGAHIHCVRLIATSACHVEFGASPTADSGDMYLAANREELFTIKPGQKVAVIQNSAAGTLYVTEMTQ